MSGGEVRVGVDVGGTKCLAVAIADPDDSGQGPGGHGPVLAERQAPTPAGADRVLATIEELVHNVEADVGAVASSVGIGLPGLVDRNGVLRFAPNLKGAEGLAADVLVERLGKPVRAENDATCAAWGERLHGAGAGFDDVLLVTLGTGIGGGIVAGGRLLLGANGFAGEVGHMVIDAHGPPCPCGRQGCWERFGSGTGLGRLAREAAEAGKAARMVALAGGDPEEVRGEHATIAAAGGDGEAVAVLEAFSGWVAMGLANLANLLDPQVIIVGGGLVEAGDVLMDPLRAAFAEELIGGGLRSPVPVVAARLGARAGAMGAACLDP